MAKDPVCGMDVDEKKAPAQTNYDGKTFYFCAPACKVAFEADPKKYVGQKADQGGCSCCGGK